MEQRTWFTDGKVYIILDSRNRARGFKKKGILPAFTTPEAGEGYLEHLRKPIPGISNHNPGSYQESGLSRTAVTLERIINGDFGIWKKLLVFSTNGGGNAFEHLLQEEIDLVIDMKDPPKHSVDPEVTPAGIIEPPEAPESSSFSVPLNPTSLRDTEYSGIADEQKRDSGVVEAEQPAPASVEESSPENPPKKETLKQPLKNGKPVVCRFEPERYGPFFTTLMQPGSGTPQCTSCGGTLPEDGVNTLVAKVYAWEKPFLTKMFGEADMTIVFRDNKKTHQCTALLSVCDSRACTNFLEKLGEATSKNGGIISQEVISAIKNTLHDPLKKYWRDTTLDRLGHDNKRTPEYSALKP